MWKNIWFTMLLPLICAGGCFSQTTQLSNQNVKSFDFHKGHTWVWHSTKDSDWPVFENSLEHLAQTGADSICIVIPADMKTYDSTEISWGKYNPNTPSDALLLKLIRAARQRNMKIVLKPMVNCQDGTWRARIAFNDDQQDQDLVRWEKWWDSYKEFILYYARIAQDTDTEMYNLGCEMNSTEGFEKKWRHLIAEVRKAYSGLVTYNPNHDRLSYAQWFDDLDVISISAYFKMAEFMRDQGVDVSDFFRHYSKEEFDLAWATIKQNLNQLVEKHNKPLFFIECGICNGKGCSLTPWEHAGPKLTNDLQEQARFYEMLFEQFWDQPWFMGYAWWAWPSNLYPKEDGPKNINFTIHGKPAEQVVKKWYAKERGPAVIVPKVKLSPIDTIFPEKKEPSLSDPKATAETKALYRNLHKLSSKGVLFGHQETLAYGVGWKGHDFDSDVYKTTGKFPAVFGWDFGHLEQGRKNNIDGISFQKTKEWVRKAYDRNGINTFSWHSTHPDQGTSWTIKRVVNRILPGGDLHTVYVEGLDRIAAFLHDLKGPNGEAIPIVFRPFHEQHGRWFWWGSKITSQEELKQLWRFTADYLRNERQVHNMILCYSPNGFKTKEEYMRTYPGDDYVDIFGLDDYDTVKSRGKYKQAIRMYETIVKIAEQKNKIAAITETGLERIPQQKWWTETLLDRIKATETTQKLSWVMVWRNGWSKHHYVPYPGHPSSENFNEFEDDPFTVFLSDLPDMYH